MKEHWHRVLPYAAIALDLLTLWANATNNDFVTLDNLKFHLIHWTEHLIDAQWYAWIFDCLQSFPEKYSDLHTEEFAQQLTDNWSLHGWYLIIAASSTTRFLRITIVLHLPCFSNYISQWGSRIQIFTLKWKMVFTKFYNQVRCS